MNKTGWISERILFGLLIILGYFCVVVFTVALPLMAPASVSPALEQSAIENGKNALLVVGPLLGVIVTAIWKSDRTDKQNADTVNTLASAVTTAMSLPAATPEPPK